MKICISLISNKSTLCGGEIRDYKITGWAAPISICKKHLKEYIIHQGQLAAPKSNVGDKK